MLAYNNNICELAMEFFCPNINDSSVNKCDSPSRVQLVLSLKPPGLVKMGRNIKCLESLNLNLFFFASG